MATIVKFLLLLTTVLVDGSNVSNICDDDSFTCDDGGCVLKWHWCDTMSDCEDRSDEKYCARSTKFFPDPNNCTERFFKCQNGQCIPKQGICDGFSSCQDNSDENNCEQSSVSNTEVPTTEYELKGGSGDYPGYDEYEITVNKLTEIASSFPLDIKDSLQTNIPNELNDESIKKSSTPDHNEQQIMAKSRYFTELKLNSMYKSIRNSAIEWIMSVRDENFGWGVDTPRALAALYLSNPSFVEKDKDSMIMLKNLHLQISISLMRNTTIPIHLSDLALYINSLMATCSNPRNFHGIDLVSILRQRTNLVQPGGSFISPLIYLTLCLSNSTSYEDVKKVREIYYSQNPAVARIDVQALATLAASCFSRTSEAYSFVLNESAMVLFQKVTSNGLPENVYELSLVAQALNEARVYEYLWNRSIAMDMIMKHKKDDGSFGDILSTYYVLPLLHGRSLASIGKLCNTQASDLTPLEILKNTKQTKIFVRLALRYNEPVEMVQFLQLRVANGTNFFDIMRLAAEMDSNFRFKYCMVRGVPAIYSIKDMANDAERGIYWALYVSSIGNSTERYSESIPYTGDIRRYFPGEKDESVFWLKSLT